MLKDRGNIKWTGLMLPKHKEFLEKIYEARNDVEMPEIDEQKIQELNYIIMEAMQEKKKVTVTFHKNKRIQNVEGKLGINDGFLSVDDTKIDLNKIIDIKLW